MTRSIRFSLFFLVALTGCSLATDFDRFHPGDQKGNVGDGDNGDGDIGDDGGSGDGDGDSKVDGGPKIEGQIDVVLAEGALGTVTSEPAGIDCGTECSEVYPAGTVVVLTANPDPTAAFVGWGGDCQGQTGFTCTLTAGSPLTARATFTSDWFDVTVSRLGAGTGSVKSTDGMIRCDGSPDEICIVRYERGATVNLQAMPTAGSGSTFAGWGGGCAGDGACGLMMTGDKIINAVFDAEGQVSLIVTKEGEGEGTVSSDDGTTDVPASISCGSQCAASFPVAAAKVVTLTATADGSSVFKAFTSGCQTTTGNQCSVTMDAVKRVKAKFELKERLLDIAWAGKGAGSVATLKPDVPPVAPCVKPDLCPTGKYLHGTTVKLEAQPATGSTFKQWSVTACGTNPVCEIQMMADTLVVATFDVQSYPFTQGTAGPGANALLCTVDDENGDPQTAACLSSTSYAHGTVVTIAAVPASHNVLGAWGQACAGTPVNQPCVLTITAATNVLASFQKEKYPVTLAFNSIMGGTGSVSGGLTCSSPGAGCTIQVDYGTDLSFNATAGANSNFVAFTGCDSSSGNSCTLNDIAGPKNLTVTFESANSTLNNLVVNKVGGVGGNVTSGGGEINCGGVCSAGFNANATVQLTATALANYNFSGFTGACSGGSPCSVTVSANPTQVQATFTPKDYPVTLAANTGNGTGKVTGQVAGVADIINCGQGATDCTANLPFGSTVTLTATPALHSQVQWGGVCASFQTSNQCSFTVGASNPLSANFNKLNYTLLVNFHGDGLGGRNSLLSGNGLDCPYKGPGTSCQTILPALTAINLTATPPAWARLAGFGGACSGATCAFSLQGDPSDPSKPVVVDVSYDSLGALAFVTAGAASGQIDDPRNIFPRGARAGDDMCQNLADAQGLPAVWKAWLSDGNGGAAGRFKFLTSATRVVMLNGDLAMKGGWEAITKDTPMSSALIVTESGKPLDKSTFIPVWTATNPKGDVILEDTNYCGNWQSNDPRYTIHYGVGNAMATDPTWTANPDGFGGGILIPLAPAPGIPCDTQAHLYCFQDVTWPPPKPL